MFKKISFKVAVLVNIVLFIVIAFGTIMLVKKQYSNLDEKYKEQGKNQLSKVEKDFIKQFEAGEKKFKKNDTNQSISQ